MCALCAWLFTPDPCASPWSVTDVPGPPSSVSVSLLITITPPQTSELNIQADCQSTFKAYSNLFFPSFKHSSLECNVGVEMIQIQTNQCWCCSGLWRENLLVYTPRSEMSVNCKEMSAKCKVLLVGPGQPLSSPHSVGPVPCPAPRSVCYNLQTYHHGDRSATYQTIS